MHLYGQNFLNPYLRGKINMVQHAVWTWISGTVFSWKVSLWPCMSSFSFSPVLSQLVHLLKFNMLSPFFFFHISFPPFVSSHIFYSFLLLCLFFFSSLILFSFVFVSTVVIGIFSIFFSLFFFVVCFVLSAQQHGWGWVSQSSSFRGNPTHEWDDINQDPISTGELK